jgi:ribose/xylose/arabinose/galactoside ABC-type transport system permease subunit
MTTSLTTPPATVPEASPGQSFLRRHWSSVTPIIALVVLVVVFALADPRFFQYENALNILRQSAVLLVLAMASTIVIMMGSIDLSVGSVLCLTAFAGAMMAQATGSTTVLLLLPLIGAACGLLNGALVAYGRLPSFLVTLGLMYAFDGIAKYLSGGRPISVRPDALIDAFGGSIGGFPTVVLWALLALVVAVVLVRYTRFGRYMYALGGNEKAARLSGVPAARYKIYAFLVAGLFAGLAGLLQLARARSASPDMGEPFLLPAIAAVVMGGTPLSGGVGGPARTVTGVLIIAILGNGMVIAAVDPFLQNVIQGLVVIAAVALTIDRAKLSLVK